jgi:hypothetical protein
MDRLRESLRARSAVAGRKHCRSRSSLTVVIADPIE